jgi:Na+/pantothenate symporter
MKVITNKNKNIMKTLEIAQVIVSVLVIVLGALGLLGAALASMNGAAAVAPALWISSFVIFFAGLVLACEDFEKKNE